MTQTSETPSFTALLVIVSSCVRQTLHAEGNKELSLGLQCLHSSFGKQGPSPLPTFTPREEVGKVFHANEEREGLMDLGGSCVY